eukprot:358857-Chlamydomonas_euryale.AAC.2
MQDIVRMGSPAAGGMHAQAMALWHRPDSLVDDAEFYSLSDSRCEYNKEEGHMKEFLQLNANGSTGVTFSSRRLLHGQGMQECHSFCPQLPRLTHHRVSCLHPAGLATPPHKILAGLVRRSASPAPCSVQCQLAS